jgi:hypothetical protein
MIQGSLPGIGGKELSGYARKETLLYFSRRYVTQQHRYWERQRTKEGIGDGSESVSGAPQYISM